MPSLETLRQYDLISKEGDFSAGEIARMTGLSKSLAGRIKRVQKYDPESYQKILRGEEKISTAAFKIQIKSYDPRLFEKVERNEISLNSALEIVSKATREEPKPSCSQQISHVSKEEVKKLMFESQAMTFKENLRQLIMSAEDVNLSEIINFGFDDDMNFYSNSLFTLEAIAEEIRKTISIRRIK